MIGRVLPLAQEFAKEHEVHIAVMGKKLPTLSQISLHTIGREPFVRTPAGKIRLRGIQLSLNMLRAAFTAALLLHRLAPDIVIIAKPLPANVLGVWLWSRLPRRARILLDIDDFELTANKLSSLSQRFAVHWASRVGASLATCLVTSSPFLNDHYRILTRNRRTLIMIPTGIVPSPNVHEPVALTHPVVAYFGSLAVASGHRVDMLPDILIKLREQVPTVTMLVAGHGEDELKLRQEFDRRGLSAAVEWLGAFQLSDIPSLLARTHIVLDPIDDSINARAKSSFRCAVAVAHGAPFVSSNIGIRPYWLPRAVQSRFFAVPGDASSYARLAANLIARPLTHNERMSLRTHAAAYSWPRLASKYVSLFA